MAASEQIDNYIAGLNDWRGKVLADLRQIILDADNEITEDWKWNSPVWSKGGMIVSISAFKDHVGINFFQGASLPDPQGLFNSGMESKKSRSINLYEGDEVNKAAFQELVRSATGLAGK